MSKHEIYSFVDIKFYSHSGLKKNKKKHEKFYIIARIDMELNVMKCYATVCYTQKVRYETRSIPILAISYICTAILENR